MDRPLWAPWRIEYILGDKPKHCVFCAMPEARAAWREELVLVVQPHAFVCMNRYPFTPGHLLVVPRRHVASLEDLSDDEYAATTRLLREAITASKQVLKPEGHNVGFNLGKAAGAGIAEHLHAHVVPRWIGDVNFMPIIGDVKVMPEYLDQTWAKLRVAVEPIEGEKAPLP